MSNLPLSYQAVVTGGGLVGKAAALALSHAGLRVALLAPAAQNASRAPAFDASDFDTRVYALSASSHALLTRLKVWSAMDAARITPVTDMRVLGDASGALHFSAYQAGVAQLAWIVESAQVEAALDTALRFQPQLDWRHARAQALAVHDKRAVLTLDDGQVLNTDLVVGADGAHSWVRAQMDVELSQRDYGQTGVVANFKIARPHGETAWQWFHQGEVIALLPLPGNHVSLVWSAQSEHADRLIAEGGERLAATLETIAGTSHGAFECVTPPAGFPLTLQTVDRLVGPRVALIGDAAHVIHPLAGQGANLGMRDVACLVDVLKAKESFRDYGDPVLLRRFERARREDIASLTFATDGLQRLFALPGPLARGVRNLGMRLVGGQPLLKRWLVAHALG